MGFREEQQNVMKGAEKLIYKGKQQSIGLVWQSSDCEEISR